MKKNKIRIFLLFALAIVIIINAWLCDDAYISFRVIKNFVSGYGLRWNLFERVQVFTNPLMVLTLIPFYAITHEIYYTAITFNVVTSIIALYILLFKLVKSDYQAILVTLFLLFSRSFIGFTTSGLENSVTFLLLSLYSYFFFKKDEYNKKDIMILSLITSLILLNRMDSILLVIPATIYILIKKEKNVSFFKFIIYYLIGMLPFICWEVFSLIYYGFLFPNTFYAKLTAGIPKIAYLKNSIMYFSVLLRLDSATILTLLASCLFISMSENKKLKLLLYGILISVAYIIWVGGDFMLGRFLTPALFMSVVAIGNLDSEVIKNKFFKYSLAFIAVVFFGVLMFHPRDNNSQYGDTLVKFLEGVADEQSYYFGASSLIKVGSEKVISDVVFNDDHTHIYGTIGYIGYFSNPKVKIIDQFALGDPFLSRVPLKNSSLKRVGHIEREIPKGYFSTIETGKNVIKNKNLKEYYEVIKTITQDKIFTKKRLKTIIKYHLGKYDYLIDNYLKSKED